MERRFLRILKMRFRDFTDSEVEQHALLAELKMETDKLAFRRAAYDMMTERFLRERRAKRFLRFFDDSLSVQECAACSCGTVRDEFARYLDEEEWHGILSHLPPEARMLAHIAKVEAESFAKDPRWTWCKPQRELLVTQIKRRFIAWNQRHSERAFFIAKRQLTKALRRNRRRQRGEAV